MAGGRLRIKTNPLPLSCLCREVRKLDLGKVAIEFSGEVSTFPRINKKSHIRSGILFNRQLWEAIH